MNIFSCYLRILPVLMCISFTHILNAQFLEKVRDVFINEYAIGYRGFFQDDFDQNGKMEFLADADRLRYFFKGSVEDQQIVTHAMGDLIGESDYVISDMRYEDTDGDGIKEFYAYYPQEGMFRYDLNTLQPIDTLEVFQNFYAYQKMTLIDVTGDDAKEWILLSSYGLYFINPVDQSILHHNDTIRGRTFHIGNLDLEPSLELVIIGNKDVIIMDLSTYSVENKIYGQNPGQSVLVDINKDGRLELLWHDQENLKFYNHEIQSTDVYADDDFTHFLPYDINEDGVDEILLYEENKNYFTILQTFPLAFQETFQISDIRELGIYLDRNYLTPNDEEIIFRYNYAVDEEFGLSFINPKTRLGYSTLVRGKPNAQFIDQLGAGPDEYLTSVVASDHIVNAFGLADFKIHRQVLLSDIFDTYSPRVWGNVFTHKIEGTTNNRLFIPARPEFSVLDLKTGAHGETDLYYFSDILIDDYDFDGHEELLSISSSKINIEKPYNLFEFQVEHTFTGPGNGYELRTAQLDDSLEKEIIAFSDREILVYNGMSGVLKAELDSLTDHGFFSDFTTFTDGEGNFYLAIIDTRKIYFFDYSMRMPLNHFEYSASETHYPRILSLPLLDTGQLKNYFIILSDTLKVFDTNGELYYTSDEIPKGIVDPAMVISDYDKDQNANIITSGHYQYAEFETTGEGQFNRSFYLTKSYPEHQATLPYISPFVIHFSEPVDPASVYPHIQVISKNKGPLEFTIEAYGSSAIHITTQLFSSSADTITLYVSGELRSNLGRLLDINHDEVSMGESEPVFSTTYYVLSADQCCNPTIQWTEAVYYMNGDVISERFTYDSIPEIHDGHTYYQILRSQDLNGNSWMETGTFIRHENSRVFQYQINGEQILMDFDLNENEQFVSYLGTEYIVTNIDTLILENGESRKRLELHCEGWVENPVYWIDGIGSTAGLYNYETTCAYDIGSSLLCVWQNGDLLFRDPVSNTCWLQIVSTADLLKYQITYSPNPVEEILEIHDPENHIALINLFDLHGRKIYSGSNRNIDMAKFPAGNYLLSLQLKSGQSYTERVVKLK